MISLIPKGSKITIKDLMDEAAALNRNDVYLKLLKLKEGQTLTYLLWQEVLWRQNFYMLS